MRTWGTPRSEAKVAYCAFDRLPFIDALRWIALIWNLVRASRQGFAATSLAAILALAAGAAFAQQSQNYYYDPAGRLIVVVDLANGSATYNYDANGNIVSVTRSPLTTVVAAQVSPSAATAGATVTIYGTAFGTTANTTVSFHGAAATISAATTTSYANTRR